MRTRPRDSSSDGTLEQGTADREESINPDRMDWPEGFRDWPPVRDASERVPAATATGTAGERVVATCTCQVRVTHSEPAAGKAFSPRICKVAMNQPAARMRRAPALCRHALRRRDETAED